MLLRPITRPRGSAYSPIKAFSLQLKGHLRRWNGADISSSSTLCSRPGRVLFLLNVVIVYLTGNVHNTQDNKKPLFSGVMLRRYSPHLAESLFRRNWHPACNIAGGLPGFIGPFPSTLLMRAVLHCVYSVFNLLASLPRADALVTSILKGRKRCQG